MKTDKLKEIINHLEEWVECDIEDDCPKCNEMRQIIIDLTRIEADIAEAITEAIKLEKDNIKQWLLDEGYEILSEKI